MSRITINLYADIQNVYNYQTNSSTFLVQDLDGVALTARDDGRGVAHVEAGNGLNGMEERLRLVGGELKIESSPGTGFSLHAWIPVEGLV